MDSEFVSIRTTRTKRVVTINFDKVTGYGLNPRNETVISVEMVRKGLFLITTDKNSYKVSLGGIVSGSMALWLVYLINRKGYTKKLTVDDTEIISR